MPFNVPALAVIAALQGPPQVPVCEVLRIPDGVARPTVDAVLDDAVWAMAPSIGPLAQVEPIAGNEPSERTEVRICYDEQSLFLHLLCFDTDPAAIRATQMQRDADLDPDDRVEILIDPFFDRRNAFWFQISPAGSKGDALITRNGSNFNKQWDGIWYGRARITDRGWEAEIEIPVKTINFDPGTSSWGFNLRRNIRRRSEEVRWASATPRISFFSVANAGTLGGIEGMDQGVGLDLIPFAVADYERDRSDGDETTTGDAGLDLFWRLTPDTKLSVSVNTDFAETEVDAQRVNLTRFPLFFPEKRDFFLEDSGAFVFGETGGRGNRSDVLPFFSRRIGLDGSGGEVPLLGAVKYTGQVDGLTFGLMDVQTDEARNLDSENLFVGRVSKAVLEQSDVGAIWTHGNPQSGPRSDTFGADFNYRTDTFLGDRNLRFSTWVLKSDNSGVDDDDLALSARVAYPNDEIDLSLQATLIERHFDPKLGFVRREGVKQYQGRFRYRPRINTSIRQLRFSIDPTLITNTANETETERTVIQPLGFELESGDEFGVTLVPTREVLDEDFDITSDVTIPVGDYDFLRYQAFFSSSEKRPVSVELQYSGGDFYDGERVEVEVELAWRASRHALFDLEYEWNDVDLADGDFTVNVARLRATLLPNPRISWSNFMQYDDLSDSMGLNSRLWWIFEPGNEAFLVLNQGWDSSQGIVGTETNLAFKVGYTFRF